MRILYVYGDDDYGALSFESECNKDDVIKRCEKEGTEIEILDGVYANILEFKEVDMKFVEWLQWNMLDEDFAKHTNFYIIEEEKK